MPVQSITLFCKYWKGFKLNCVLWFWFKQRFGKILKRARIKWEWKPSIKYFRRSISLQLLYSKKKKSKQNNSVFITFPNLESSAYKPICKSIAMNLIVQTAGFVLQHYLVVNARSKECMNIIPSFQFLLFNFPMHHAIFIDCKYTPAKIVINTTVFTWS